MIQFNHVYKTYETTNKTVHALKNINLTIKRATIFGVIGYSGAGKSTLIRTVNLLEGPTKGEVLVDGKDLSSLPKRQLLEEQKKIGMIFQHFNLLNSKTVFDNVALPLTLSRHHREDIESRVHHVLQFVGLESFSERYPDELSGGQKQRVGIARALVTNPDILLCDEVTSALDPQTTIAILQLLKEINERYQITILMITHEMDVIKEICHEVAVMEDGEIIESANIFDLITDPQHDTTRNFVQSIVDYRIPSYVAREIQSDEQYSKLYRFQYKGDISTDPVVSQLSKRFAIDVNILQGNIVDIQGRPFGNLLLQLIGEAAEISRAVQYSINNDIKVEEVGEFASRY